MVEELLIPKLAKAVEMEFGHILAVEANRKEQTMRLIDADMLIRKYIDTDIEKFSNSDVKIVLENLKQNILKAPSIDIVRCSECKYWVSDGGALMLCDIHKDPTVPEHFCSYGCRDSEKPNNCEHITEDGVTCAKYPACDDCPDNPLNKVRGSERLVKGSEKPNNSTISKMEQVQYWYINGIQRNDTTADNGVVDSIEQTERSE